VICPCDLGGRLSVMFDSFEKFRCFWTNISLDSTVSRRGLEVPIAPIPDGFGAEGTVFWKSLAKGVRFAALQPFGIGSLGESEMAGMGHLRYLAIKRRNLVSPS